MNRSRALIMLSPAALAAVALILGTAARTLRAELTRVADDPEP